MDGYSGPGYVCKAIRAGEKKPRVNLTLYVGQGCESIEDHHGTRKAVYRKEEGTRKHRVGRQKMRRGTKRQILK